MKKLIKKILQEQEEETPSKGNYHREGDVEEWRINPYEFQTNDYKELLDAIDKLPETIKGLSLPNSAHHANTSVKTTLTPSKDTNWKDTAKQIILALTRRGEIKSYSINSYYGTVSKDYEKHPYYVSLELKGAVDLSGIERS